MQKRIKSNSAYIYFIIPFILPLLFISCHSHKKMAAGADKYHNPRFIDNIYMGGNANKNYISINDIIKNHREYPKEEVKEASSLQKKYAGVLLVQPDDINNYNLYKFIDEWYGVNYHLGGTEKSGIDCSGFAQLLYRQVYGINLVRTAIDQFSYCNYVRKLKHLKEGDLVFFHIHSKHITHVGIYLANNFFVHASSSRGVAIDNLKDAYWSKYFAGGGEVPRG